MKFNSFWLFGNKINETPQHLKSKLKFQFDLIFDNNGIYFNKLKNLSINKNKSNSKYCCFEYQNNINITNYYSQLLAPLAFERIHKIISNNIKYNKNEIELQEQDCTHFGYHDEKNKKNTNIFTLIIDMKMFWYFFGIMNGLKSLFKFGWRVKDSDDYYTCIIRALHVVKI